MLSQNPSLRRLTALGCLLVMLVMAQLLTPQTALAQTAPGQTPGAESTSAPGGPIRIRQPAPEASVPSVPAPAAPAAPAAAAPARPGEFETFVNLPRFGADLVNELAAGAADFSPVVPPEYIVQGGDELQLTIWGSVDADLRLVVDRSGRISIPRVGPVMVAGVRFGDLQDMLTRRVAQTFKNFELSVSLGRLRGVRVYVTGFVQRPGAYSVAGLSTVMNVVMRAGGPATAGSFRQIELRRGGKLAGSFDLYDLLLRGDRSGDRLVQPDDVIHVLPAGAQVALRGSVNKQAVYELRAGESLGALIRMAGGFSPVADRSRVALERLDNRNAQRVVQLQLPEQDTAALVNGDVVRVFSAVDAGLSVQRQNKRVRVDGEVMRPGEYVLPAESSLSDALRAAGGLTPAAYLFAANFQRESVRVSQQENLDRALRDMETELVRESTTQRVATTEEAAGASARTAANARLIERLRGLQPTGRLVFQIAPDAAELPDIRLEDGDRLTIPPRPSTVGVFGSVFNTGSYLYSPARTVDDYLRLAGGPTKGADESSVFVVRVNGQVVSSRQQASGSWFGRGNQIADVRAEPGDTVFVPEEFNKSTFIQMAKDWTQILFQLGIGAAGFNTIVR
jgi:protein involved in polysaccharide export with SLBB domain